MGHPTPSPTTLGPRLGLERLKRARRSQGKKMGWLGGKGELEQQRVEKGGVFIDKGKPASASSWSLSRQTTQSMC